MIAAVAVDVALPHLDRTFDYRVPDSLAPTIAIGSRVRVAFAGRLVSGYVMALHDDASRATAEVRAVSSLGPVLPPSMAQLVRAVADRYASTFADVARFAVPPRHVRAEAAAHAAEPVAMMPPPTDDGPLAAVRAWAAFRDRAQHGQAVAACIEVPTAVDLDAVVVTASLQMLATRSVVIVVPDVRDVHRLEAVFSNHGVTPIVMRSGDGPSVRQRAFTTVARAERAVVIGTRSAVFAPLRVPAACIVVGDGHDGLVEVQTPGWAVREVAMLRSVADAWPVLFLGRHRSIEMQQAIEKDRVKPLAWPDRRRWSVHIESVPERLDDADPALRAMRIPPSVFSAMRAALQLGPVLISVAHRGYVTALRCGQCREQARCAKCGGPLARATASGAARCRWCAAQASDWQCTWCGGTALRHSRIGAERTVEEIGRAFPGVPVRLVDAEHPLDHMSAEPQLLIVTPGMEPVGAARLGVILDADVALARHDLAAPAEAVRRWHEVAAAVAADGRVLIVGSNTAPAVQALVRADPAGFAERELATRRTAGLPPAMHAAVITAPSGSRVLEEVSAALPNARILGPVPCEAGSRWIVLHDALEPIVVAVRAALVRHSAAKTLAGITVRVDPLELPT